MELLRIHCPSRFSSFSVLGDSPSKHSRFRQFLDLKTKPNRRCSSSPSVFVVNDSGGAGDTAETGADVLLEKSKSRRYVVSRGYPAPLGATARDGGVNFAICSANAVSAKLCLIALSELPEVG